MNKFSDTTREDIRDFIVNNEIYNIVQSLNIPKEIVLFDGYPSSVMGHVLGDREIERALNNKVTELKSKYQTLGEFVNILIESRERDYPDISKRMDKVGVSRQYKHKLINNKCRPTKQKLICLAIGLRLNIEETETLLRKAEYSLIDELSEFDCIVAYFIKNNIYSTMKIDNYLEMFGQPTIFSIE